jgi:hypothetical protein
MRAKGYSDLEAANLMLQMQMRCAIQKIKGGVSLCPGAVVANLLLILATAATAARLVLRTIKPNQMDAHILMVGGINSGILPSLERKL